MKKWFLNIEFSIVGLVIIGMILKLLHLPLSDLILMIAFLTLAFIYLFFGLSTGKDVPKTISPFDNETPFSKIETFTLLAAGNSLSVCLVGILFQVLHWEGSEFMLMVGTIGSAVAMILVYFILRINQTAIYNFIFFRQLPITFMAAAMWYLGDKMSIF